MSAAKITDSTFEGLAFPVVKVRYHGPTDTRGSRWVASYEGRRISRPYDSAARSGAANALPVARELWERVRADESADYVAVPLDLDTDTYGFAFVASYILGDRS